MLEDHIVCAMKDVSAGEAQLILSILPLMCKTSAGRTSTNSQYNIIISPLTNNQRCQLSNDTLLDMIGGILWNLQTY